MNRTIKADLKEISASIESIVALLPKLSKAEMIDVGAHINTIKNNAEKIDKTIKGEIEKWRKHTPGEVRGEYFKAILAYYDITRLNQTKLKEAEPAIHSKYSETNAEKRIVYTIR